ncbi:peptidylprolyl isomerase [Candidatus Magnetomorum sp. HK-1]|nr:peptidylprolyl isomerase [Candidatus Magnetomorum sp. HK-1]
MLHLMRKHATSWIIKFLLIAIAIVFVFWGVGSFREENVNRVAEVNGTVITIDQYYDAYNNVIEGYKRQFGDNLDDKLLEALNIKQQVVNTLIERELVLQEAKKLKIRVTDEELASSIKSISYFQKDGIFDNRYYVNVLRRNRMTPEQFEISQRRSLYLEKLRGLIIGSVKVADDEAREWFEYENETVNLDYIAFESDRYTDIKLTEEAINEYYEKNKDNYQTELEIKVAYVHFDKKKYMPSVKIEADEIQTYFETHKSEFESPKTVEARHILLKVDADSGSDKDAAVKKRAQEVYQESLKKDADFAKLAQKFSEGPSKDRGGYLGKFKKEDMVKPFSDQAFSMKTGEISEPVRTSFGWHIIKVENVNEATSLTLAAATPEIQEKLINERSDNLAYDAAESFFDTLYNDSLTSAAQASGLSAIETDFFGSRGPSNLYRDRYSFSRAAFELEKGQTSEIMGWDNGYYIIQLLEKKEPFVQKLVVVRDRVEKDLKKELQIDQAYKSAVACLNTLSASEQEPTITAKTAKVEQDYSFTTSGVFKRNEAIPEIGNEKEINTAAFSLTESNPFGYTVYKGLKGYYVIKLKERKQPDDKAFQDALQSVKDTLRQKRENSLFENWIEGIKMNSKIEIEERYRK